MRETLVPVSQYGRPESRDEWRKWRLLGRRYSRLAREASGRLPLPQPPWQAWAYWESQSFPRDPLAEPLANRLGRWLALTDEGQIPF